MTIPVGTRGPTMIVKVSEFKDGQELSYLKGQVSVGARSLSKARSSTTFQAPALTIEPHRYASMRVTGSSVAMRTLPATAARLARANILSFRSTWTEGFRRGAESTIAIPTVRGRIGTGVRTRGYCVPTPWRIAHHLA